MRYVLPSTALIIVLLGATGAFAKKSKRTKESAQPKMPVSVQVKNECQDALSFSLNGHDFKGVAPGALTAKADVKPGDEGAYQVSFPGSKVALPYLFFAAGGSYRVKLSNCRSGVADLRSIDLSNRPDKVSPQAAAKVRFRASRGEGPIPNLEYRAGERGRFKKLSLGMTSYTEIAGGDFEYALRLRGRSRGRAKGPVMKNLKSKVKLEAGHKYLIEAQVVAPGDIILKVEDEGWSE